MLDLMVVIILATGFAEIPPTNLPSGNRSGDGTLMSVTLTKSDHSILEGYLRRHFGEQVEQTRPS